MNPNISALVASFLPDHVPARYPAFVEFAKAYFDFLEKSNMAGFYSNSLPEQRSIHTQQDQFLQYIQRELGIFVPRVYAADPKVFYDKITELWRSKGSEEAIKTFFLLFLDDVVEITYPWANVLIPSDGRWIKEDILRVTMKSGKAEDLVGKQIKQVSSEAAAIVSKVESRTYSDGTIYDLTLIKGSILREFDPQEDIVAANVPGLRAEIYRSITGFTIVDRGTGYKVGDRITVQGFDGFTFVAFVSAVSLSGEILDIQITNFGSGNTPIHVRLANVDQPNPAYYYLRDFVLYQYLDDQRDGPQETWSDKLISEVTPTIFDLTEAPGLGTRSTVFEHDYVEPDDIFFADDYVGVSSSVGATTPVQTFEQIRRVVLVIDSEDGVGAELLLKFGSITGYPGRYDGVNGQLDESIVLQDSYYNQKYSYEVKTIYSTSEWINQLTRAVHPAGTKVFGNVAIFNKLDSRIKSGNIFIGDSFPPRLQILEEVCVKEKMLGFIQDYVESAGVYFAEDYVGTTVINELINQACENQTTVNLVVGSTGVFYPDLKDRNESVTTPWNINASGNLLANTTGGDGTYSITAYSANGLNGVMGLPLTIPNVGAITMNTNGSWLFDPVQTFSGQVPTITYFVTDAGARTDSSTLDILVQNPQAGTVLFEGCLLETFTYRKIIADGSGGTYFDDTLNSYDCGFTDPTVPPPPEAVVPQFFNLGFEQGFTGWESFNQRVLFGGGTTLGGFPTPAYPGQPNFNTFGNPLNAPNINLNLTYAITLDTNDKPPLGEIQSAHLYTGFNDYAVISPAGGTVFGPALYSNFYVQFDAGDQVSFDWKALPTQDAYSVVAYMVEKTTGQTITLVCQAGNRPETTSPWQTTTVTVPNAGAYKFVFVSGSWDATFGTVVSGQMLVDNIRRIPKP